MNYTDIALACCSSKGYSGTVVGTIGDRDITDSHIADVTTRAYLKQRQNFPMVCGSSPKEEKRRQRRFNAAVEGDVKRELGIGALAIIIGMLGGPIGVILAVATCVFEWLLDKELNDRTASQAFAAAALGVP